MKSVIITCITLTLVYSAKLPPSFKICKRTEPDLNKCFKEAVQVAIPLLKDGLPELNIETTDPLVVDAMEVPGDQSSAVNVHQKYKNLNLRGISTAIVDDTKVDITDNTFKADVSITIPLCTVDSIYDFHGQLLMLPLTGSGDCHIEFENIKANIAMTGEGVVKDGTNYVKLNDLQVKLIPDKASFHFDNLFNGDKELGDHMNEMINENWQDLFGDVAGAYETMLAGVVKNVADAVFNNVPYDDLLPE